MGNDKNPKGPDVTIVGTVESLWRYPIKSMAGEAIERAFLGFAGMYGDRIYGFVNSAAPAGTPFFTARNRHDMLLYRPQFRDHVIAAKPPNQTEAEELGPGLTPLYPSAPELAVDVQTPAGETLAVDDPALVGQLARRVSNDALSLVRSDRAMTDCRPVSLISLQTIQQLGEEISIGLDKRRFRANVYVQLTTGGAFAEDFFVGRQLQIGSRVVVAATVRDERCKMITIDPDTAELTPAILRNVARSHGGHAGIYCAILTEGMVQVGDQITLLDRP
jgi:uncharacterized protein YcbX